MQLLAVSKTKPPEAVVAAYKAGQRAFGENYVQEGVEKIAQLASYKDIEWHFIGPLQSNKTKQVAENFAWVHSIDRLKIAKRLSDQRPASMSALQVLIQVNIDDEDSKSGISAAEVIAFAEEAVNYPRLRLRGLMAIPAAAPTPTQQQKSLKALYQCFQNLQQKLPQVDTLSVGMSNDLEAAIYHGSTMVRVGTDIFGARSKD